MRLRRTGKRRYGQAGAFRSTGTCALALSGIIICLFTLQSFTRNSLWREDTALWEDAVRKAAGKARVNDNLGRAYLSADQYEDAIVYLTRALELDSAYANAANVYNNRGLAHGSLGHTDRAIDDFSRAIMLSPTSIDAYSNRGLAFELAGRLDLALEDYNTVIALEPADYLAYSNRGTVFGKMGLFEKAVMDHTRVLSLNPGFVRAYLDRGDCYRAMRKLEFAERDYQKACDLGSEAGCEAVRKHQRRLD